MEFITPPIKGRNLKPRDNGLTMILDKGLGVNALSDILDISSEYIDFVKLSFGTSYLYPEELLREKIELVKSYEIDVYPGGTFFEIAMYQQKEVEYINKAKELGYNAIEISDGTLDIPSNKRIDAIKRSVDNDFTVISEIGQKNTDDEKPIMQLIEQINTDLENGVFKVIVESRESGKNVVIFDENGKIKNEYMENITQNVDVNNIIWETPEKKQQLELIKRFGNNVNLGNINPHDILTLESLRQGLRGDTFRWVVKG